MTAESASSSQPDPPMQARPHAEGDLARVRGRDRRSDKGMEPSKETFTPRRAFADETGATMLEWALLLAAIGIPSYWIIRIALDTLTGYYAMMTTLNGLPLP